MQLFFGGGTLFTYRDAFLRNHLTLKFPRSCNGCRGVAVDAVIFQVVILFTFAIPVPGGRYRVLREREGIAHDEGKRTGGEVGTYVSKNAYRDWSRMVTDSFPAGGCAYVKARTPRSDG